MLMLLLCIELTIKSRGNGVISCVRLGEGLIQGHCTDIVSTTEGLSTREMFCGLLLVDTECPHQESESE